MTTVERLFTLAAAPFDAACRIGVFEDDHPSARLHGHGFVARVRGRLPDEAAPFPGGGPALLRDRLRQCVGDLDHRYLNDIIALPTDENIARWIRTRLADVPGIEVVGVQSTGDEGADLDEAGRVHVWRRYRFEAAHRLPNVPPGHKCGRMHGHGFEVILHVAQDLGQAPMGPDFARLDAAWAPFHEQLHYACLNDIDGLDNPTSEVIAGWLWQRLADTLPELSWVSVYETATAGCHYDGHRYRIWKERVFESAVRLARAPAGDRRRRLHGHSYLARLHIAAPLDTVMGWTMDYGDVKSRFEPVYRRLDHHRLDELDGLADNDPESLVRWIADSAADALPEMDRIDLYETPGNGVFLDRGAGAPALPAQLR